MIIFRRLNNALIEIEGRIRLSSDNEELLLNQNKYDALRVILDYSNSLKWLSHKKTKEKVRYFLNCDMNYRKTAEFFQTGLNRIEVTVSYASSKLEKFIGASTLTKILDGEIDEAMVMFTSNTTAQPYLSWFLPGVTERLPVAMYNPTYTIEECKHELWFLNFFSVQNASRLLDNCDTSKLSHTLYILASSQKKYKKQKEVLSELFSCYSDEEKKLNAKTQVMNAIEKINADNFFRQNEID